VVYGDQMHLISNQPEGRLHSQLDTGVASRAHKRNGREQARLNPGDGARIGIEDGATIRLWNERGACLATATLDDAVMPSVIQLSTGAWLTQTGNSGLEIAGNPNILTLDVPSSKFGQGCTAHSCLVRVEPYAGEAPDALEQYRSEISGIVG